MAVHHQFFPHLSKRGALVALTFALAATFVSPPKLARAQDAFHCIEDMADDNVTYRINKIEQSFKDGKKGAAMWRYIWGSILLGVGGAFTYLAIDRNNQGNIPDRFAYWYLAAGSYLLGTLQFVIPAPDVWGEKRIRKKAGATPEERKLKLRYATNTLKKAAGIQGFMSGPVGVVAGVAAGVAGGSVKAAKWSGSSRGITALLFILPPVATGLMAATAPKTAVNEWEGYRSLACSSDYYESGPSGPEFDLSLNPTGARFVISF